MEMFRYDDIVYNKRVFTCVDSHTVWDYVHFSFVLQNHSLQDI